LKFLFKNKAYLLTIGLILVVSSVLLEIISDTVLPEAIRTKQLEAIQNEVVDEEQKVLDLFDELEDAKLDEIYDNFDQLTKLASKYHIFLYVYDMGNLRIWTSNKVLPNKRLPEMDKLQIQELSNGYYLQINRTVGNLTFIGLIPVQANYPLENNYLKNTLEFLGKTKNYELDLENSVNCHSIFDRDGNKIFSLKCNTVETNKNWVFYLYFFGGFLIFVFINIRVNQLIRDKKPVLGIVFILSSVFLTILGWRIIRFPKVIFEQTIFSPEIYASGHVFSSLGDLFITLFLLVWIIIVFTNHVKFRFPDKIIFQVLLGILFFSVSLIGAYSISFIVNGLVVDSNISLDMSNFFKFDTYTFISYIIIFLVVFGYIRLCFYFYQKLSNRNLSMFYWIIIILIPSIIFFILDYVHLESTILIVAYAVFTWVLMFFYKSFDQLSINYYLAFILISAGFVAHQINDANISKEKENRKILIETIATNRDVVGETLLTDIIEKVEQDGLVKSYFTDPLTARTTLQKRLKQLYFSGYFSRYDLEIFTYTTTGLPFKNNSIFTLEYFNELLNSDFTQSIENDIYFVNNFDGAPEYLLVLPIAKYNALLGKLLIVLKQKRFLEQSVYPELLIERNVKKSEELGKYSYAIYKNGNLSNQKGEYSYPLTYFSDEVIDLSNNESFFMKEGDFDHLVYKLNDYITIIMSKEKSNIFNSLSLFSVLFILSTIFISIVLFVIKIYKNTIESEAKEFRLWLEIKNLFSLTFKSKIQLSILMSITIALVLTGISTISYINYKNDEKVKEKLRNEMKAVTQDLDEYFVENSLTISSQTEKDKLEVRIKNLADLFESDINIFDTDGNLIESSQMPIYERKIISHKMDAEAFNQLRIKQKSQLVQTEKIGGFIEFFSAYALIRDSNNRIFYFINIPYYAKEKELRQELYNLIVTTVNLYVFLFLLIILISFAISNTFTEPLEIIRNHIREVQLGKSNKKISWSSKDEIGSLIEEYNVMIKKVEESATALARTERESAWREMAKQVAHEIKNPLTPMKLNIQQLIRAWDDKRDDLDERFHKTTQILIHRIDSLSQIATEFSAFARMPEIKNRIIILEDILSEVSELFDKSEKAEVTLDMQTENTKISADQEQLSRAFNNLIKNAIQAIPEDRKGQIHIKSVYENERVTTSIKDNGSGIPDDLKDKIFTPNFSTKSSGMGLGLAIVSRVIESAKGKIWFDTEQDVGTTFFISFEIVKDKKEGHSEN
jgi:two-component system nitrogen regulation sensor histidine kinase NtrY